MSAPRRGGPRLPIDVPWIDRWIAANRDLAELERSVEGELAPPLQHPLHGRHVGPTVPTGQVQN